MAGIRVAGPGRKPKPKPSTGTKPVPGGSSTTRVVNQVKTVSFPQRSLDTAAHDYARLLSDPCNAKLVPPVYPGADAGFLFRADSFGSVGTGAGQTSGTIHWTPGYPNSSNTEFLLIGTAGGSTAGTAVAFPQTPGKIFIDGNSRAVRCIAACLRISFPGAESARSGRVHYGQTPAGLIDVGNSTTPDEVAQALTNYSRTPADMIELIWKPTIADTDFCDPTEAPNAAVRDRHAALTVAFVGLPSTVGITYHMTTVYEWQPKVGLGVSMNPNGKATTRNTLDDVVDYLIARGETFVHNVASSYMGGMAQGLLGAVSATFGNMPAMARIR